MKLDSVLDSLDVMGFFRNRWLIQIVVTKGKNLKKDDQIFECLIPVREAKHFFGGLDVIVSRMENVGEYNIPTFWFLLAYEEK